MRADFEARLRRLPSGCLVWTGPLSTRGYGYLSVRRRKVYAHRFAWELHFGRIPRGKRVLHHCDNKPCTEPTHLFLGTNAANTADMLAKGRESRGEARWNARLTAPVVIEIRRLHAAGTSQAALVRQFGLTRERVSRIVNRRTWRHL